MKICDYCGAEIAERLFKRGVAIKEYCGSCCNDYFCDEECQQNYNEKGAKE